MEITDPKILNPKIYYIEEENLWWSKDDVGALDYFKKFNTDFAITIGQHLKGNSVSVQAGGHLGWMIRECKQYFDYIYTFEPTNTSFQCLCLNCPEDNIYKFQACVGETHKLLKINECLNQAGANHIAAPQDEGGADKIPMLMIDDLSLDACDFLQLDLEGYEYYALLGARQTIEKFKPLLCIEQAWGARYGVTPEMLNSLIIGQYGYTLIGRTGESDHIYKVI